MENTMLEAKEYIILSPKDNVALMLSHQARRGLFVENKNILFALKEDIPYGHKFALEDIKKGNPVFKYGQTIGVASRDILQGEHVHADEINYIDNENQFFIEDEISNNETAKDLPDTFWGYVRENGQVGTRNYIIVVAPVNCSSAVVRKITQRFDNRQTDTVDGIVPITYDGGCAQSFDSKNHHSISQTIAGWIDNPNVVGCLLVGLGCETVNIDSVLKHIRNFDWKPIDFFNIQEAGGVTKSVDLGVRKIEEIVGKLPVFERTEVSVKHLVLGLNCGGSDIFSGITANPALGVASDILVSKGGSAVLAETPECNGAETYLKNRCVNQDDKEKLDQIINWWQNYTAFNQVKLNDNLSKGNMEGGISTILEKSLGAVSKAGKSPVAKILNYAEPVTANGLLFMDTPGFDPVSVTGLVAGGCNLIAFTTGRGSMFNASIVPTVKISTNTKMYETLSDDMDLDAGLVLEGVSLDKMGRIIYKNLIETANGKPTKGEIQKMGTEEFVPWQFGEIL
jgi:altronate hydrolase